MINVRLRASLLLIGTVLAFGSPAIAKPSDWADIVDTSPKKKIPYDSSRSVERAPVKSSAKSVKAEKPGKKKAKKAPRRAKSKRTRH